MVHFWFVNKNPVTRIGRTWVRVRDGNGKELAESRAFYRSDKTFKANWSDSNAHLVRFYYLGKAVVLDNKFEDPVLEPGQFGRATMRIAALNRAETPFADAPPTRYGIFSGNTWQCGPGKQCLDIAPVDSVSRREEVSHLIFERNELFPSVLTNQPGSAYFDLVAHNITIRNNILVGPLVDGEWM